MTLRLVACCAACVPWLVCTSAVAQPRAEPASTAAVATPGDPAARADPATSDDTAPDADSDAALRWPSERWPRARAWEYVAGPVLIGAAFFMRFGLDRPEREFSVGTAFDRKGQSALSVRSHNYHRVVMQVGNAGFGGIMVYRGLEDLLVVGLAKRSWDVALQMLTIDAQVFGLVGAIVWGVQLGVGRLRPHNYYCETDATYREEFSDCSVPGDNRSFISGHTAVAVAGAGVSCLHHARLSIYPEAGARAVCGGTAAMAVLTTVARSTTDNHWPTDMLLGGVVGFVAGWIVPRLLHYGWARYGLDRSGREAARGRAGEDVGRNRVGLRATVVPQFQRTGGGLRLIGVF